MLFGVIKPKALDLVKPVNSMTFSVIKDVTASHSSAGTAANREPAPRYIIIIIFLQIHG